MLCIANTKKTKTISLNVDIDGSESRLFHKLLICFWLVNVTCDSFVTTTMSVIVSATFTFKKTKTMLL